VHFKSGVTRASIARRETQIATVLSKIGQNDNFIIAGDINEEFYNSDNLPIGQVRLLVEKFLNRDAVFWTRLDETFKEL